MQFQFSVIGLCETWLTDQSPFHLFDIPDYNFIYNNRQGRSGGGMAMYIHNAFLFTLRHDS